MPSNIIAVTLGAIPNYLINRAWTFNKRGAHSFTREVLPFWGMAILGLIISTFAVAWAAGRYDENTLILMAANIGSFGLLWVGRFFILDRLLFKPLAEILEEHEDAEGHFHLHAEPRETTPAGVAPVQPWVVPAPRAAGRRSCHARWTSVDRRGRPGRR